ncbi:MAG: DUF882 domain-containing protein [Rhodobacteraceae bacterium]|nr:DUF882 domain-containing protein [Paracoccaceae bacterium]
MINTSGKTTRRAVLGAFAGIAMIPASPVYSGVFGYNKGAGNIRRVALRSGRTGESIDTIYWIEGKYIRPALEEINYFMRDWRENAVTTMDRRNIDLIAAAHNLLDTDEPFHMLSGYRTQRTNNLLRSRSRRVAKKSYHVKAMAADLRLGSRSVGQIAQAGLACRSGGVGKYYRSNFVHLDCGPIRTWVS